MLQLATDLNNPEAMKKTLEELIEFVSSPERLDYHLEEYANIYPAFGNVTDGKFKEFTEETEKLRDEEQKEFEREGINYCVDHLVRCITSESLFFRRAASHRELHPVILRYVDSIIKYAGEDGLLWSNDETPAGTDAIESLALMDPGYINKYIEFLRASDDSGGHQMYGTGYILKNHRVIEDTLRMLAVRLTSKSQGGDEEVGMFLETTSLGELLKEEKNAQFLLKHLHKELLRLLEEFGPHTRDEYRDLYFSILEDVFREYPVILNGIEEMKRAGA